MKRQPPSEVQGIKAAVRERDGMACVMCGISNDQHVATYGVQLEVHRTTPGGRYAVESCVTLCKKCHGPQPRRKRFARIRDPATTRWPLYVSVQLATKVRWVALEFDLSPSAYVEQKLTSIVDADWAMAVEKLKREVGAKSEA